MGITRLIINMDLQKFPMENLANILVTYLKYAA
jgi:hypothetical protein